MILDTNGLLSLKLISAYSNTGDDLVLMPSQNDVHPVHNEFAIQCNAAIYTLTDNKEVLFHPINYHLLRLGHCMHQL